MLCLNVGSACTLHASHYACLVFALERRVNEEARFVVVIILCTGLSLLCVLCTADVWASC